MKSWRTDAPLENIDEVAETILGSLPSDAVLFLRGDLAAGKTTLVKALAKARGYDAPVTSPTFSIQQVYGDDLFHYDLYQCPTEKFLALGLLEEFEKPGLHLVEWGDESLERFLKEHGFATAVVKIAPAEEGRSYEVRVDA